MFVFHMTENSTQTDSSGEKELEFICSYKSLKKDPCQAWWFMPVIPVLGSRGKRITSSRLIWST
jgi:hypothetical protein